MLAMYVHPLDESDLVSLTSPSKEKLIFIMVMNPMSFDILMSSTRV